MHKHVDELIAEIKAEHFFKDNPHLIDEVSIYRWVSLALRNFGTNVMDLKGSVIEIKNYKHCLGNDFGRLSLAAWCKKEDGCDSKSTEDKVLKTYLYGTKEEVKYIFGEENSCTREEVKTIEKIGIHYGDDTQCTYNNIQYVRLGRGVESNLINNSCINRSIVDSPYSINVKGQTISANFKDGHLYIEYYAIPTDEDGIPLIPLSEGGYLEEYLEYLIKRKILEQAQWSKDATNLQGIFQYTVQREDELRTKALKDISPITLASMWKMIGKRRNDLSKYEINLGSRDYSRYKINK
jgi:hypothetical protein